MKRQRGPTLLSPSLLRSVGTMELGGHCHWDFWLAFASSLITWPNLGSLRPLLLPRKPSATLRLILCPKHRRSRWHPNRAFPTQKMNLAVGPRKHRVRLGESFLTQAGLPVKRMPCFQQIARTAEVQFLSWTRSSPMLSSTTTLSSMTATTSQLVELMLARVAQVAGPVLMQPPRALSGKMQMQLLTKGQASSSPPVAPILPRRMSEHGARQSTI